MVLHMAMISVYVDVILVFVLQVNLRLIVEHLGLVGLLSKCLRHTLKVLALDSALRYLSLLMSTILSSTSQASCSRFFYCNLRILIPSLTKITGATLVKKVTEEA